MPGEYLICTRAEGGAAQPVAVLQLEATASMAYAASDWLHPWEQQTHASQTRLARQQEFLHGRVLAKRGLAFLGVTTPATQLQVRAGCFGQPLVSGTGLQGYGTSISHASPAWVGALAFLEQVPMGLDIELLSPRPGLALATRLTPTEQALIVSRAQWGATALWAAKEALAKLLRTGLSSPFALFEVTELAASNGYYEARFHFFPQITAALFCLDSAVLALAVPAAAAVREQGYHYAFDELAAQLTKSGAGQPEPRCCFE